jgi:hypothetical protein
VETELSPIRRARHFQDNVMIQPMRDLLVELEGLEASEVMAALRDDLLKNYGPMPHVIKAKLKRLSMWIEEQEDMEAIQKALHADRQEFLMILRAWPLLSAAARETFSDAASALADRNTGRPRRTSCQ